MKTHISVGVEITIIISLINLSRFLTSEYRSKIYDTFIPLGKDAFEFVRYSLNIFTFFLAAIFWCVLMCIRLYIKSLLNNKADSKHVQNQKNKD